MAVTSTTVSHADEYSEAVQQAMERALEQIGIDAEAYAKLEISTPKPHAGGSVRPNIISGTLRNSITHAVKIDEKAVYIGTNVEYAPDVELGTSRSREYPYLRPAATEHTDEYRQTLEEELKGS